MSNEEIIQRLAVILERECQSGDQHMSWDEVAEHVTRLLLKEGLVITDTPQ